MHSRRARFPASCAKSRHSLTARIRSCFSLHIRRIPRSRGEARGEDQARLCRKSKACFFTIRAASAWNFSARDIIEYQASGQTFRVGHFSFFQVNNSLVDDLVREVVEREEAGRSRSIFSPAWAYSPHRACKTILSA